MPRRNDEAQWQPEIAPTAGDLGRAAESVNEALKRGRPVPAVPPGSDADKPEVAPRMKDRS